LKIEKERSTIDQQNRRCRNALLSCSSLVILSHGMATARRKIMRMRAAQKSPSSQTEANLSLIPDQARLLSDRYTGVERRRHVRKNLKLLVSFELQERKLIGHTATLSMGGLCIISDIAISQGTPLTLQCALADLCYLNLSGQVVYCDAGAASPHYVIGAKFSGTREWEEKILLSAIDYLSENPDTQESCLLSVLVSEDVLALESKEFYVRRRQLELTKERRQTRQSCIHAAKITGWGSYLPPTEITNEDVNSMLKIRGSKTKFADVVGHLTGIQSRRYAGSKIFPSDLAVEASRIALKNANIDPQNVDVIVSCGVARDVEEPATSYIIQEKLGAVNAYCFDLANACNGFISALDVVDSFIASGRCETGLVAVGDVLSQYVTWDAHSKKDLHMSSMSYTFGDAGGAAVLQPLKAGDEQGIRARWFLSDGSYWRVAVIPLMDTGLRYFKSNAANIEAAALEHVPGGVKEVMKMLDWDIDHIALIIPHQVSAQIIEGLFLEKLAMPREKIYWSFPNHGNVGAASMPVALCTAVDEGRLRPGDKVLLVGGSGGFGAGVMGLVM
jgi:acyl-CoA:acyl-CoA alkyltransferase